MINHYIKLVESWLSPEMKLVLLTAPTTGVIALNWGDAKSLGLSVLTAACSTIVAILIKRLADKFFPGKK